MIFEIRTIVMDLNKGCTDKNTMALRFRMLLNRIVYIYALTLQFIKFTLVGVTNSVVLLTVYYIVAFFNAKLYLVGNAAGYFAGVVNSFFWNRKFVFKGKTETAKKSFAKTVISYCFTFLLQTLFLWIMVERIQISGKIAPLINIALTTPINYFLNKYWAFKEN